MGLLLVNVYLSEPEKSEKPSDTFGHKFMSEKHGGPQLHL